MSGRRRHGRYLSFTEIDTALTCFARWDFTYGGRLAGSTLRPRRIMAILSEGRAWGAAVTAWHANYYVRTGEEPAQIRAVPIMASYDAHAVLRETLELDAVAARKAGMPIPTEDLVQACARMERLLDDYMATATPLRNLTLIEGEIRVPLLSRTGDKRSNLYRFHAHIDGYTVDEHGHHWLVEFKLRRTLHTFEQMQVMPQYRWYCWGAQESGAAGTMEGVRGIIVDERLNEAPKLPKLVRGKRRDEGMVPSHDKAQIIRPEDYIALCAEHGVEPHPETVSALREREWQKRTRIEFRPSELVEAGAELTSAARLIRDLDSGVLHPIRNGKPSNCNGCRFRSICPAPQDTYTVEAAFERTVPKRLREPEERRGTHVPQAA